MKITAVYTNATETGVAVTIVDDDGTVRQITGDLPLAGPFAVLLPGVTIGAYQAPSTAPRTATTYQLMSALTDAQWTAYPGAKPTDQRLFGARDTPWPETNAKVARIATVLGTTPAAWFDAALGAGT